jgi:4-hydroxy-tetrahydrodipicolinate synthase
METEKMKSAAIHEASNGLCVIAPTPFSDDGTIDASSTDSMVDFFVASGATGLTILGVMGEAPKLATEEARDFIRQVLSRTGGRIPVVVGVSAPSFGIMRDLASMAMDAGAGGVMIAPQPGLQGDEAVERYLAAAVTAVGPETPVCLQDFPPINGVHISVRTILKLTAEYPNLVMFKHEDFPGLNKLSRLRAEASATGGRRLSVMVGNSGIFLPHELDRGADGAMTGFAFPEMLAEVCRRHSAGDRTGAFDLFDAYLPLVRYEQQPGISLALRKEMLRRRGIIRSAAVRTPGPILNETDHAELRYLISRLGPDARSVLISTEGLS